MPSRSSSRYINLRVPRAEYDKLKLVRNHLKKDPNYSWVESLALGALIGLMAVIVMDELSKK